MPSRFGGRVCYDDVKAKQILPSVRKILEIYHVQNGGKLNTFSQELTNINNLFGDGELKNVVKNIMKLDKNQKVTRETESDQAVVQKNRNPVEYFYSDILNVVEKRKTTFQLTNSWRIYKSFVMKSEAM